MHGTIPLRLLVATGQQSLPPQAEPAGRIEQSLLRALDVTVALVALVILLPLLLVVMAAVFVSNPGPIFFAHRRIGRGGQSFPCLKFRTMVVNAEERLQKLLAQDPEAKAEWERDFKLRRDPRITAIGGFLRKSSLDELPQLLNVLRGEMSIVGPRPIVMGEVDRYNRYIAHYCSCRPGITGLWQISGRNDTSYRRRVALDVAFARSRSLGLYIKILSLTIPSVVLARGSY